MRNYLYNQATIETLIQFEYSAFEEATVPVCTFAFQNRHVQKKGCYLRLVDFRGGMEVQRQKRWKQSKIMIADSTMSKAQTISPKSLARRWRIGGATSKFFPCQRFEISMNLPEEIKRTTMSFIQETGGKYLIQTGGSRMQMGAFLGVGQETILMLLIGLQRQKNFMPVTAVFIIKNTVVKEAFVGI